MNMLIAAIGIAKNILWYYRLRLVLYETFADLL